MAHAADQWVTVAIGLTEARANELALVLTARNIPFQRVPALRGWEIWVPLADAPAAATELTLYRHENTREIGTRPVEEVGEDHGGGLAVLFGLLVAMAVVFSLSDSQRNFLHDNEVCRIMNVTHRTPGNLRSFVVCKLKSLTDGRVVEKTFRGHFDVDLRVIDASEQFLADLEGIDDPQALRRGRAFRRGAGAGNFVQCHVCSPRGDRAAHARRAVR